MSDKLVKVNLHGQLGEVVGNYWEVAVSSVAEATHAIEIMSNKLYKFLSDKVQENVRYRVIVNGKDFYTENEPNLNNLDSITKNELRMLKKDLETIDIIPVLEGAGKIGQIFTAILGVILIVIGAFTSWTGGGAVLIAAGISLLAAGVIGLLTKPPKFEDFREIEQGGKTSYLFSGPQNIIGEGGPVPLGYGRLLVGSQVISSAYVIRDFDTEDTTFYLRDEYGNLNFVPPVKPPPFWYSYFQNR